MSPVHPLYIRNSITAKYLFHMFQISGLTNMRAGGTSRRTQKQKRSPSLRIFTLGDGPYSFIVAQKKHHTLIQEQKKTFL